MDKVGISELKAKLSEYLAHVKAGEEVLVTERGRPVAKIVPLRHDDGDDDVEWERLRALERAGVIKLGPRHPTLDLSDLRLMEDPTGSVRRALIEEREQGW